MKDKREFETVIATSPYLNCRRRSVEEVLADRRTLRPWGEKLHENICFGGTLAAYIAQARASEVFQQNVLREAERRGWTIQDDEITMG